MVDRMLRRDSSATTGRIVRMPAPQGFTYVRRGHDVAIFHHGRLATTLRGARATRFLDDVRGGGEQELMARLTGNYKRGNERVASKHVRNRR
jgi:hypothetical protein